MTTYVLSGPMRPESTSTPDSPRTLAHNLYKVLEEHEFVNFEVQTAYHTPSKTWQLLIVLLGPWEEFPSLLKVNDVLAEFRTHAVWESSRLTWVEDFRGLRRLMDEAGEYELEDVTSLECRYQLGEVF
ncbi:uncharacterized protein BDV14DRAFT_203636 [Aspergillus stella-maris]|uniref:uncharacterized protein n=1 Tax=Aspergillus stella-maris TaxID=1810926 RepID=UPI003CCD3B07